MTATSPLWQWSAGALAKAIREKGISSQEVVRAHLARIDAVNPQLNAVTRVLAEAALAAAEQADAQVSAGASLGPLHGVPITIKESLDLVGTPTSFGVVALKDSMAKADAPVIAHLKRAGAIPLARTNLPDFGLRWHTDNDLYGATRNPWDPAVTPGGSSGGEAAAIASGMSPLGVGNDMGGSLRYPAQCCGITALRPSFGRVSRNATAIFSDPPAFYEQVAAVNGPMARHVADLRLALEVMSGPDHGDPCWIPAPALGADLPRPIGVALTRDPMGDGASPSVAAAIERAAAILADAGYRIEEVDPPEVAAAGETLEAIANREVLGYLPEMLPMMSEAGQQVLKAVVGETEGDLGGYIAAIAARHRIAQEWRLFMTRYPLVLGPVSTLQPFEVGGDLAGPEPLRRFVRSLRLTETCNLLGLPALVLPVQMADGLPQAVQLIGARYHEDLCFDAGEIIEREAGVFTPVDPRAARRSSPP